MSKSFLTVGIILLGVIALSLLVVLNNYSTGDELDYYLVKETADAAMEDSLDEKFYATCGVQRIDKEEFVESFILRFANGVDAARDYTIGFYDINEVPPKVSIKIDSLTTLSIKNTNDKYESANITTNYDAILESKYKKDIISNYNMKTMKSDDCINLIEKYGYERK